MSGYQPVVHRCTKCNEQKAAPQIKCHFIDNGIRITRSIIPTSCRVVTCIHIIIISTTFTQNKIETNAAKYYKKMKTLTQFYAFNGGGSYSLSDVVGGAT